MDKLRNLKQILTTFELTSGLKINLEKSSINVENVSLSLIGEVWGCPSIHLPISYLGMPLGGNLKSTMFWAPIIEKISKKLNSW